MRKWDKAKHVSQKRANTNVQSFQPLEMTVFNIDTPTLCGNAKNIGVGTILSLCSLLQASVLTKQTAKMVTGFIPSIRPVSSRKKKNLKKIK